MAEYNNNLGFAISPKGRNFWLAIIKEETISTFFNLPPLFKEVSSNIKFYWIGFILIFVLEFYATFGVALIEGVDILMILVLVLVDIFFAYLPHWKLDAKINKLQNSLFISKYKLELPKFLDDNEIKRQNAEVSRLEKSIKMAKGLQIALYIPIILSACTKLYLFFIVYPFFNTYQAYIVIIAYVLGCVLHIMFTGHVINYYLRFKLRLSKDKNKFDNSEGRECTAIEDASPITWPVDLVPYESTNHKQKIVKDNDNTFKIMTTGVLFDEELDDLINKQTTKEAKITVAVFGKGLQITQLAGQNSTINNNQ